MALICAQLESTNEAQWLLNAIPTPPNGFAECPYLVMSGADFHGLSQSSEMGIRLLTLETKFASLSQTVNAVVASSSASNSVDFLSLGITPESVMSVFGFGFGAIMLFWFLGFCVSLCLSLIRKV